MKLQHLLSYTRRAIQDYDMIQDGDKIAIGISGGKDSLTLARALRDLQRFYPKSFSLHAITISLGFDDFDTSKLKDYFELLEISYTIYETQIADIIFKERKESNPCSLCSKMRKGALIDISKSLGCNKIALGHNKDDINETLLMSLFYEGRIHTMSPVNHLDIGNIAIIRPLIYAPEADIRSFSKKNELPVLKSPCPADGQTKREHIKQLIYSFQKELPHVRENIFGAIQRSPLQDWNIDRG